MESAAGTLFVIVAIAFVSPLLARMPRRLRIAPLVFEILLGILVGPAVLDIVKITSPIEALANLGLATLMFQAGFEIDSDRTRGRPIKLAFGGWCISLALGFAAGIVLTRTDVIETDLYVGLALTTTALGTLLPIVRDTGLLPTKLGTHILAVGSVGEFAPIVGMAFLLSATSRSESAFALSIFGAIIIVGATFATKTVPQKVRDALTATLRSSGQLYVRLALLLIVGLAFVADALGLDFLLGAFAAGMLFRIGLQNAAPPEELDVIESKVEAVTFGFLIPIFFVVTGIKYDLEALTTSPTALAKLPMFLALFLLVRAVPILLYRKDLPSRAHRRALAFLSGVQLPLVVAITTIGINTGQMRSSTAAAMVGAGMITVVIFPAVALGILGRAGELPEPLPSLREEEQAADEA